MTYNIQMAGAKSASAVMVWLRDNGCPRLDMAHFIFADGMIIVSSMSENAGYCVGRWEEPVQGCQCAPVLPYGWFFRIDGKFYFATKA